MYHAHCGRWNGSPERQHKKEIYIDFVKSRKRLFLDEFIMVKQNNSLRGWSGSHLGLLGFCEIQENIQRHLPWDSTVRALDHTNHIGYWILDQPVYCIKRPGMSIVSEAPFTKQRQTWSVIRRVSDVRLQNKITCWKRTDFFQSSYKDQTLDNRPYFTQLNRWDWYSTIFFVLSRTSCDTQEMCETLSNVYFLKQD